MCGVEISRLLGNWVCEVGKKHMPKIQLWCQMNKEKKDAVAN